ncbi:potassium:proton antiporter [Aureococcus anophagefferens]|nr:potassium:proton antiporter [Aureococcus anophagefferens]
MRQQLAASSDEGRTQSARRVLREAGAEMTARAPTSFGDDDGRSSRGGSGASDPKGPAYAPLRVSSLSRSSSSSTVEGGREMLAESRARCLWAIKANYHAAFTHGRLTPHGLRVLVENVDMQTDDESRPLDEWERLEAHDLWPKARLSRIQYLNTHIPRRARDLPKAALKALEKDATFVEVPELDGEPRYPSFRGRTSTTEGLSFSTAARELAPSFQMTESTNSTGGFPIESTGGSLDIGDSADAAARRPHGRARRRRRRGLRAEDDAAPAAEEAAPELAVAATAP